MTTGATTVPERDAPTWREKLRSNLHSNLHSNLRHDLPASLVVFLVAVPLSLGIAVASDAPLTAGLIAAAVGGLVAGALGGSAAAGQRTRGGPHGRRRRPRRPLRLGRDLRDHRRRRGCCRSLFGLTRTGRAALAISPAVVHGMLAGIGVTIVLGQLHVVLGGEQQDDAIANVLELPGQLISLHGPGDRARPRRHRDPAALAAAAEEACPAGCAASPRPLLAVVAGHRGRRAARAAASSGSRSAGRLLDAIAPPVLPRGDWGGVIVGVFTIAIIASVESLLSRRRRRPHA